MKTSNKILLTAFGICFLLISSLIIMAKANLIKRGDEVVGLGAVTTDHREVADFAIIELQKPFDVIISKGPKNIQVRAEQNLLPYILTKVKGNRLKIMEADGKLLRPRQRVTIEVSVPHLEGLLSEGGGRITMRDTFNAKEFVVESSGSGKIEAAVECESLEISNSGSGSVKVSGMSQQLLINNNGSGKTDASGLIAREADVHCHGSGSVRIQVSEKISGAVSGSGNVYYEGDAKSEYSESGSGRFIKMKSTESAEAKPADERDD